MRISFAIQSRCTNTLQFQAENCPSLNDRKVPSVQDIKLCWISALPEPSESPGLSLCSHFSSTPTTTTNSKIRVFYEIFQT